MTGMRTRQATERATGLLLFALYLVTAVRLCRYASWVEAGSPNPFLPTAAHRVALAHAARLRHAQALN